MQPNLDGNDWPCNMFWRPRKFSVRVPGGANSRGSLTSFSGTQNGRGSVKEKSYALQLCVLQLTPPDWLQPTNCVSCFSLVVPGYSLLHTAWLNCIGIESILDYRIQSLTVLLLSATLQVFPLQRIARVPGLREVLSDITTYGQKTLSKNCCFYLI